MQLTTTGRRRFVGVVGLGAALALAAGCGGAPAPKPSGNASAQTSDYTVLSPAATADGGDVVGAIYRETQTLDPIQAFDYPENTIDPLLCDSLLRQAPDMTIGDGLAKLTTTSPTQFDFEINADATFWDGTPVTAEDAVFSLERAADPNGGGFYAATFSRVKSIDVTGEKTFSIILSEPDYWLLGELSATPG